MKAPPIAGPTMAPMRPTPRPEYVTTCRDRLPRIIGPIPVVLCYWAHGGPMKRQQRLGVIVMAFVVIGLLSSGVVRSQGGAPTRFLTPPAQVVAVRAGRLFDSRSGTLLANQIVLIRGDRIVDVGPGVAIPAEARVIDLSGVTVLPGMIDAHVHLFPADTGLSESTRTIVAVANAQTDLNAGFTTVLDM